MAIATTTAAHSTGRTTHRTSVTMKPRVTWPN
jgi:hypothetical protein